jgi:hypothetical protein
MEADADSCNGHFRLRTVRSVFVTTSVDGTCGLCKTSRTHYGLVKTPFTAAFKQAGLTV